MDEQAKIEPTELDLQPELSTQYVKRLKLKLISSSDWKLLENMKKKYKEVQKYETILEQKLQKKIEVKSNY